MCKMNKYDNLNLGEESPSIKTCPSERGATMIEAAIGLPLFLSIVFFASNILPLSFAIIGTHAAFVESLREISAGPIAADFDNPGTDILPGQGKMEQRLMRAIERRIGIYSRADINNVEMAIYNFEEFDPNPTFEPAFCFSNAVLPAGVIGPVLTCQNNIVPGSFVMLRARIPFLPLPIAGMDRFEVPVQAIMRVQEF